MALAPPDDPRRPWQLALRCGRMVALVLALPALVGAVAFAAGGPFRSPAQGVLMLGLLWVPSLLYVGANLLLWQRQIWAVTALIVLTIVQMGALFLGLAALVAAGELPLPGALTIILWSLGWLAALGQYLVFLFRCYDALPAMTGNEARGFEPILRPTPAGTAPRPVQRAEPVDPVRG
jgi:hypothetical protein